jgi:hypothetical protein
MVVLFFISGCDLLKTKSGGNGNLTATLVLTDTTGRKTSTFHSGEPFEMCFSLANTRTDTLTYVGDNIDPPVVFQISRDDSLVWRSPLAGSHHIVHRSIPPGDTLQGQWKVAVALSPGSYVAGVSLIGGWDTRHVNPMPTIPFSVVQ